LVAILSTFERIGSISSGHPGFETHIEGRDYDD